MERRVIEIDQERCNGCGLCVNACAEGAIGLINGKARLLRDDYCDGLGNCLPACPQDAIHFKVREAAPFDETAVKRHMLQRAAQRRHELHEQKETAAPKPKGRVRRDEGAPVTALQQWPVQLQLVSAGAPYFDGADLLVAADCTAYARGNFHNDFMDGKITLIGCPKLDDTRYADKLLEIFKQHDIRSVTVTRMEVPCCGGIEYAVSQAIEASGKSIPLEVVTIGTNGEIKDSVKA
ncbi:MAG: 4Fe-4S binding protein [Clostridia bacterium]|nr:4Fe-4S binding protein [Clostridia bacterium]